mmetsp:Transcript_14615/g.31762  ORF Transcript_14615/g.31762 Transcript_14615/m.31762 type:complete len:215 (+) Transcript_14615:294-938(+)
MSPLWSSCVHLGGTSHWDLSVCWEHVGCRTPLVLLFAWPPSRDVPRWEALWKARPPDDRNTPPRCCLVRLIDRCRPLGLNPATARLFPHSHPCLSPCPSPSPCPSLSGARLSLCPSPLSPPPLVWPPLQPRPLLLSWLSLPPWLSASLPSPLYAPPCALSSPSSTPSLPQSLTPRPAGLRIASLCPPPTEYSNSISVRASPLGVRRQRLRRRRV